MMTFYKEILTLVFSRKLTRLTVSLAEKPEEIYIQKPAYDR